MGLPCSRSLPALGLAFGLCACQGLTDVEIEYVECFPITEAPYTQRFDGTDRDLYDRCWQSANTDSGSIRVDGEDLIIKPNKVVTWGDAQGPPILFQIADGDFLLAARVEAATGTPACLGEQDRAGLIARSGDSEAWWTFLLQPAYDAAMTNCTDEPEQLPTAKANIASSVSADLAEVPSFGEDGEGEIAICRTGRSLYFFYRNIDSGTWPAVTDVAQDVDPGPLEVGLTTTAGPDAATGVEGHFDTLAFWPTLGTDTCTGPLENLTLAEEIP